VREVPEGQDPRCDHIATFCRSSTQIAQADADQNEDPEELLGQRTILRRLDLGCVQPGQQEQHEDRSEHQEHPAELVRHGAQDRVEGQEVPFGHDMCGRHQGIGRDVVVRVAQRVGHVEDEREVDRHEDNDREQILHRVVRMERNGVLLRLHLNARGVVVAGHVQRPDVQHHNAQNDEGQTDSAAQRTGSASGYPPRTRPTAIQRPSGPRKGSAENRLVITVAPQKLIWPHGST
jgi:hypothetical protein